MADGLRASDQPLSDYVDTLLGVRSVGPSGKELVQINIADVTTGASEADVNAIKARTITGGGLATGGGSLEDDRVITVTKASGAEVIAGTNDTKAVTPLGDKAALDAFLVSLQSKYGTADTVGFSQSGYVKADHDDDGNFLQGYGDYANLYVNGLIELSPETARKDKLNLGGNVVTFSGVDGFTQSGRIIADLDDDAKELFGVSDDPFPQPTGAFSPYACAVPDLIGNSAYMVYTERDSDHRMRVYSVNRATNAVATLSEPGVDAINPRFDATGTRVVWSTNAADRWFSRKLRSTLLNGTGNVGHAFPSRNLLVIGDSVDAGSVATTNNDYATLTQLGCSLVTMTKWAIGGQQIWQQAMRAGAVPTRLTISGTTIATGSGTSVSAIETTHPTSGTTYSCNVAGLSGQHLYPNTLLLSTPADATARSITGWVIDSTGARKRATLSRTASGVPSSSETYAIISSVGASITTATSLVTFIPDTGYLLNACVILGGKINDLFEGINATNRTPPSAASICADGRALQDAIIGRLEAAYAVYVIMGLYNQATTSNGNTYVTGGAADLAIIADNNDRRTMYPGHFIDRFAILAAAGDGSSNDNSDIANHWAPRSVRGSGDNVHPNDVGHAAIANGNAGGAGIIATITAQLAALPIAA